MGDALWKSIVPVMQNRLYALREEAMRCAVAPLELVVEPKSGLVHNAKFDPCLLAYTEKYNNEQSLSPMFAHHMESVATIIGGHLKAGDRVIEIGCGKGAFLRMLRKSGIDATGLDPAYEGDDPFIQKRVFEVDSGMEADFLVLRHVLEHIPNPNRFLRDIALANRHRGCIFIEVPDLSWIIKHRACYDIFYEHCNYFTASSLSAQFERVIEGADFFGGQYLWVIADLESVAERPASNRPAPDLSPLREELTELISRLSPFNKRFVWGAGAKGVTLAYLLSHTTAPIDYLIDINPRKQGCFSPVSGTPIISPDAARALFREGDVVLIMNPNYRSEIQSAIPFGVSTIIAADEETNARHLSN